MSKIIEVTRTTFCPSAERGTYILSPFLTGKVRMSLFLLLSAWFLASCTDDSTAPVANRRPETHIAVNSVNTPQSSRVEVHWQGDDADGIVVGYVFSWDERTWHFTTKNDSIFTLHISTNDSSYTFAVAAIDNSLAAYPSEGALVQFNDANSNGVYDGEEFTALTGATDLSPARTAFPVRNSPPEMYLGADTTVQGARRVELPDTTFPVATFQFTLFDIDGTESISTVEWALNDTTTVGNWKNINPKSTFFTLKEADGLRTGQQNKLFLRATDIGGLRSKVIVYPPENKSWFVRRVAGPVLVIKDEFASEAADFYISALKTISSGEFDGRFDILDIGADKRAGRSKQLPPFVSPMLTESLKLYKAIIWFTDSRPTLTVAQEILPEYMTNGGKILFCTELPEILAPDSQTVLADFAPIDSVSRSEVVTDPLAIKNGMEIMAETGTGYPNLVKSKGSVTLHELYPKVTAKPLYRLPENAKWPNKPIVGVISDGGNFVFLNLPLQYLDGNSSAHELLRQVLKIQFGL